MKSPPRAALVLILALALAASGVTAPEHVHHGHDGDRDHAGPLVHRHLAAHHHHQAISSHDDDDAGVVWLNGAVAAPRAAGLGVDHAPAIVPFDAGVRPAPASWTPPAMFVLFRPHGPPRPPHSLRGPPSPLPLI